MPSIIAKQSESSFQVAPSGNHIARCYAMVEIGTVHDDNFNIDKKLVRVSWELPNEKWVFSQEKGEQPFSVHKEYTLSMHEKANLRKDLESWRGKGFTEQEAKAFDITKLIGVPCMLNVIHKQNSKGNTFAAIGSISPIPKGMQCPEQINETFVLCYSDWDGSKFDSLPDWIKDKIKVTPEYRAIQSGGADVPLDDKSSESSDDLPF